MQPKTDKFAELRRRLLFLVGALVVYRVGTHVPLPGINVFELTKQMENNNNTLMQMFNMFSGGALKNASVFAIGIMPYISASIIFQLASEILPQLKELKKEGESGRRKITQYTRYMTVVLALIQSFIAATAVSHRSGLVTMGIPEFYVTSMVCLVAGTMFLMWLGEQITERGVGNGISMIITAGIAAGIAPAIGNLFTYVSTGAIGAPTVMFVLLAVVLATYVVVFIERGQRKVLVQYAKQQVGGRVAPAQSTHLPLKLNMSGVIPPIFASSIILFPASLAGWVGDKKGFGWLVDIRDGLAPGHPIYALLFAAAIIFFCFFYTALVFNPRETADNLKRSGAFVPGIRPGEQTAKYIEKIILRLTLMGALYITVVCLLPELFRLKWSNIPFNIGGTSLLITVVVTMDFIAQVQTYIMSQQYEGLLRKANLKGGPGLR